MEDSRRRSLKVFRPLCEGCERTTASLYCTECKEPACSSCAEQLHVRGRKSSKRATARTCKGRHLKDLGKTVGVLALCKKCRTRPAYRYSNGEVYPICKECRQSYTHSQTKSEHDVVKRVIADELRRSRTPNSKSSSSSKGSSSKGSSSKHRHKRAASSSSEGDSTGDDATELAFSRESSAD